MTHVANPAIDERGPIARPRQRGQAPAAREAGRTRSATDPSIDHYLKRLDPEVAASFTEQQREAIKIMFAGRGVARHTVEVRRSIPFLGGRRFYMVFLLGPERRGFSRLYSEGVVSVPFNVLFYLALGAFLMAPLFALLAATNL